jgi:hypothetical protein
MEVVEVEAARVLESRRLSFSVSTFFYYLGY